MITCKDCYNVLVHDNYDDIVNNKNRYRKVVNAVMGYNGQFILVGSDIDENNVKCECCGKKKNGKVYYLESIG